MQLPFWPATAEPHSEQTHCICRQLSQTEASSSQIPKPDPGQKLDKDRHALILSYSSLCKQSLIYEAHNSVKAEKETYTYMDISNFDDNSRNKANEVECIVLIHSRDESGIKAFHSPLSINPVPEFV